MIYDKNPHQRKELGCKYYSNVEFMVEAVRKVTFPRERRGTARPQLEMWKLKQIHAHKDRTRNRSVIVDKIQSLSFRVKLR